LDEKVNKSIVREQSMSEQCALFFFVRSSIYGTNLKLIQPQKIKKRLTQIIIFNKTFGSA
jgi:hypothetical protein